MAVDVKIEKTWKQALHEQWGLPYFTSLTDFVRAQYKEVRVYPPPRQIFAAFDACPFEDVKVVILGQDPYHGPGQANGLAFSVSPGVQLPPSLINIFKEIITDTGAAETEMPASGDLTYLANQGVLLLNSTLTVPEHTPTGHRNRGWEEFTDAAIRAVSEQKEHVVFILWGSFAISKRRLIDHSKHLVLTSPHPSPLSAYRGFFGSRPFTRANAWLAEHELTPIKWLP